jgi:ABC-type polysaccharide/polyol phosphate export permease
MSYLLRVLMFATPVIYPVSMLSPALKQILSINPFFALFSAYQGVITGEMPSVSLIAQSAFWSVVVFSAGVWVFLRHERSFGIHI